MGSILMGLSATIQHKKKPKDCQNTYNFGN